MIGAPVRLSDRRKLAELRRQQGTATRQVRLDQPPIPPGRPPMSVPTARQALHAPPEIVP